jgi:hypothetical protein
VTEEPPAEAPPPAPPKPRRRLPRPGRGTLALGVALLAAAMSGGALVAAVMPPVVVERPAPPPPVPLASDAPLPIIGIEMLLPHLPRSGPFPRPFAVARALATGDAEVLATLATLSAAATQGAPQARQLAESFAAAADAAVLAEMGFAPDAGWIARRAAATMRFGAMLGSTPTTVLEVVQQAGEALAEGNLPAAEAALRRLSGAPAAAMAPWRDGLRRRLAADAAALRLAELSAERAHLLIPQVTASR